MRTIKASEIGTFLYCQRAWWYQRNGQPSENQGEMASGTELHYRHGRAAFGIGCLRLLAYSLILIAIILGAISLTSSMLELGF
jgi:hypothetical protein